jgi:hypothetical protein
MGNMMRASLFATVALAIAPLVAPASAGPVSTQNSGVSAAIPATLLSVRDGPGYRDRNGSQRPYGWSRDNVGSLGYDGRYYAYNRFSGQRYGSCVEDLGYGRVRPCDAGQR